MDFHSLSGVGVGDGSDLSFRIVHDSKIWEYDLAKQENCQVFNVTV